MAAEIPPTLKLVTSAIRRAEELENDKNPDARIVSYYCRYYAVLKGSKLCSVPAVAAETKFLIDEMGKLEKFKASIPPMTEDEGKNTCQTYAQKIFDQADDEDRAGAADKATVKLFYAAGTFFDIMEQFGDISPENIEKRKYAKWKATEILNAIRSGVKPTPGGYGEDVADMNISDGNETVDIPPAPRPTGAPAINVSHVPSYPELSPNSSSPVPAPFKAYVPQPTAPPMTPVVASTTLNNYYAQKPPPNLSRPPVANNDPRVEDTVELCNFAILALKKNDVALAKERLEEALRRLE